jgi:hypothetical protein
LAVVTASRAETYAGPRPARVLSGSGSSTSPMPIPTLQLCSRSSRSTTVASAAGSSRTPWNSSPAVRSNPRSIPTSARLASVAGTRSEARDDPRWSTVSTAARIRCTLLDFRI